MWGSRAGGLIPALSPALGVGKKGLKGASVLSTLVSCPGAKPGSLLTPGRNLLPSFVEDESTHLSLFHWDPEDTSLLSPHSLLEQGAPALDLL